MWVERPVATSGVVLPRRQQEGVFRLLADHRRAEGRRGAVDVDLIVLDVDLAERAERDLMVRHARTAFARITTGRISEGDVDARGVVGRCRHVRVAYHRRLRLRDPRVRIKEPAAYAGRRT